MELPSNIWTKKDQDSLLEARFAKISDDLCDIAIKWGASIKGETDKRVFQSKRFGLDFEVTIHTSKRPDNQTVVVRRGTDTGGFHKLSPGEDMVIPLKSRTVNGETPGGIVFPLSKSEGGIIIDGRLSPGDVIQIIQLIDAKASQKGLIQAGKRVASPEIVLLEKEKYKVSEVFNQEGTYLPVMPWEEAQTYINDFDAPDELTVRSDAWGGDMTGIICKRDLAYFDQRDKVLNDILIERNLTIGELVEGLTKEPGMFTPLVLSIRDEVTKRMGDGGRIKENTQPKSCSWCSGESPLNIGPGMFRDFDSDLSYGIPVCGGCGGLGVQIEDEDFKKKTQRITDLRFEYCPTDPEKQESMTMAKRLNALEALDGEVRDLVRVYGNGAEGSYAQKISTGALDGTLETLRRRVKFIEELKNASPTGDPARDALRPASIAFYDGRLKEADNLFRKVLEEYPNSSLPAHDYAVFIVQSEGDYEKALPFFIKSTGLEPKKALHFFQVAKFLAMMGRYKEAREWLGKTKEQPDYKQFVEESGQDAEALI